jgi:hypothetical protein
LAPHVLLVKFCKNLTPVQCQVCGFCQTRQETGFVGHVQEWLLWGFTNLDFFHEAKYNGP